MPKTGPLYDPPTLAPADAASHGGEFDLCTETDIPQAIGEYRIERLIGTGGMGRVYLAVHSKMERVVALKTLSAQRMGSERSVGRFYSEVRAAARLMHPNIVTAFDAGESDGIHYLAMEYVDGPTLAQVVAQSGPLAVPVAVDILRQIATGLLHAHDAGIVHRDIKPGNVMRAANNVIKLLDLGLASVGADARDRLENGRLIGTVEYMAPEQLEQADRADARSDIYALGATFYFLLTGRTPYEGPLLEQIRGHRDGPVPDLCAVRPDIDVRLDHVLRRMMAKRPQDRYASLSELLEDLDHWQRNEVLRTGHVGYDQSVAETPTRFGETTSNGVCDVLGIDLGMLYGSAARANPGGEVTTLHAAGENKPLMRLALASRRDQLFFGSQALEYRTKYPERVTHCLPLYIGQSVIERRVLGKCCPPEVLLALTLRQLIDNAWQEKERPAATAVTVPSCYDQMHRRSILQACEVAGIRDIRLIDRSVAAAQAVLMDQMHRDGAKLDAQPGLQLVVSILGNTTEVVLLRRIGERLQQLAILGRAHSGILNWQQHLVDLAAEQCMGKYGFDPRRSLRDATALQIGCERALNQLCLQTTAEIRFDADGALRELVISRDALFSVVRPWLDSLQEMLQCVCSEGPRDGQPILQCITVGVLAKMRPVRKLLQQAVGPACRFVALERPELARGAATALAAEMPGREGIPLPPLACTPHDLGVLAHGEKGTRKHIRPIVPRGTALPARTNRRLTAGPNQQLSTTLSVVESTHFNASKWRSLGSHTLPRYSQSQPVELGFEVDANGLLAIRTRNPHSGRTERLPALPPPTLEPADIRHWQQWIDSLGIFRENVLS